MQFIEDQTFSKSTTDEIKALAQSFEHCCFVNCDFSYTDLSGLTFAECKFTDCNMALVTIAGTGWHNVKFVGCKLSGVHFDKSSNFLFEVHFTSCVLDNAVFYKTKNKKAVFADCSMIETDFTEADLTEVVFDKCNLNRAFFSNTKLQGADLRTSYNFSIDPEINILKKAKFSITGLPGLLEKYGILVQS